ncbi:MAG: hypothetical protein PVJ92_00540 [Candidatus Dependentiae bacterium]|jgi:hypothetical protein
MPVVRTLLSPFLLLAVAPLLASSSASTNEVPSLPESLSVMISDPLTIEEKAGLFQNKQALAALRLGPLAIDGWKDEGNGAVVHHGAEAFFLAIVIELCLRLFLHESSEWRQRLANLHTAAQVHTLNVSNTGNRLQTFSPKILMERFNAEMSGDKEPPVIVDVRELYRIDWRRLFWPLVGIAIGAGIARSAWTDNSLSREGRCFIALIVFLIGMPGLLSLVKRLWPFISVRSRIKQRLLPQVVTPEGVRKVLGWRQTRIAKLQPGERFEWRVVMKHEPVSRAQS